MAGSNELKAYVTCALLLYVKFMVAVVFQGLKRYDQDPPAAEDDIVWLSTLESGPAVCVNTLSRGSTRVEDPTMPSHVSPKTQGACWERVIQSDLESLPLALIVFGAGVVAGGNTELFEVTLALYTIARCFHTLAHAAGQQSQRVIASWIGVAATVVGALNSLAGEQDAHRPANKRVEMAGSGELKAFLVCAFLLYVKFTIAILVQSLKSFEGGTRPPEDSVLGSLSSAVLWFSRVGNGSSAAPSDANYTAPAVDPATSAAKARDDEARWKRIVQNDLESMPLALVLFGAGVFAGGNTELFQTMLALYTIARWFHMLAYAAAKQPHRAIAFWVGMAAVYVGAINSLVGVYKH